MSDVQRAIVEVTPMKTDKGLFQRLLV